MELSEVIEEPNAGGKFFTETKKGVTYVERERCYKIVIGLTPDEAVRFKEASEHKLQALAKAVKASGCRYYEQYYPPSHFIVFYGACYYLSKEQVGRVVLGDAKQNCKKLKI